MTETLAQSYPITLLLPDGGRASLDVGAEEFILTAAYRAGLELPSMCLQGWCLTCAGQVEGAGEWDQSASRRYFPEDRSHGYILLCTAKPRSGLCIHTPRREAMRDNRLSLNLPAPRG